MKRNYPSVEEVVSLMKTEISDSISAGEIPASVSSFSALHDYVDANMFAYSLWPDPDDNESDDAADVRLESIASVFNPASDLVSAWLAAGRPETPRERLEYLRGEIDAESISYGEIAELQGLAEHIEPGDVQLLEWAGRGGRTPAYRAAREAS